MTLLFDYLHQHNLLIQETLTQEYRSCKYVFKKIYTHLFTCAHIV
jgi:hypothetical protein